MLPLLSSFSSMKSRFKRVPRDQRDPLNAFFIITSMPVGGAEVLLSNLLRKIDRNMVSPNLICMKELGHLGEQLAQEIPTYSNLLKSKWDIRILQRLSKLFVQHRADAVVTVGAGDKMFWGRLAARFANVPVVCSALHSTGWPDGIGRLNRLLTPWTDTFIGVAEAHAEHLRCRERFPASKVKVIPNGVDTHRFRPNPEQRVAVRKNLGLPLNCPLVGIVAALRPEKNHGLLVRSAVRILTEQPETHFLIIGDGTERPHIENQIQELGLQHRFHLLGNRSDTPQLLAALDVFTLCSLNEANPVSILEALSTGIPVVSTNVGSIAETVIDQVTGLLVPSEDACALSRAVSNLLQDRGKANQMGSKGRQHVHSGWSLQSMVQGYEDLICQIYDAKVSPGYQSLSDTLGMSDTVIDDSEASRIRQPELRCASTVVSNVATADLQTNSPSHSSRVTADRLETAIPPVNNLEVNSNPASSMAH